MNRFDGGQKDRLPATVLGPDQPVGLLVIDEEVLVEQAHILDCGAAKENAGTPARVDPPSITVVPVAHPVHAWPPPVRKSLREGHVL